MGSGRRQVLVFLTKSSKPPSWVGVVGVGGLSGWAIPSWGGGKRHERQRHEDRAAHPQWRGPGPGGGGGSQGASGQQLVEGAVGVQNRGVAPPPPLG